MTRELPGASAASRWSGCSAAGSSSPSRSGFPVIFYMLFLGDQSAGQVDRRHRALAGLPHGVDVLVRGPGRRPQRRREPAVDRAGLGMGPPAAGHPHPGVVLRGHQGGRQHAGGPPRHGPGRAGGSRPSGECDLGGRHLGRAHGAAVGDARSPSPCSGSSSGSW